MKLLEHATRVLGKVMKWRARLVKIDLQLMVFMIRSSVHDFEMQSLVINSMTG